MLFVFLPLPLLISETGLMLNMSFQTILKEYSRDCIRSQHADTATTLHQFPPPVLLACHYFQLYFRICMRTAQM